jgi:hypothetical protein
MAHSKVRVVSGNFVTARPLGVIDGVDYELTGVVRKVDADAIRFTLANMDLYGEFAKRKPFDFEGRYQYHVERLKNQGRYEEQE